MRDVFIVGVEAYSHGWIPFVERHSPCTDPHGDHARCVIVQRITGPSFGSSEDAIAATQAARVTTSSGRVIQGGDWEVAGQ